MREPSTTPFSLRSEMARAVLDTLSLCRHQADLLDVSLQDWPLESAEGEAALRAALAHGAQVRILVASTEWLERRGERLRRVRRSSSAAVHVRCLPETLRLHESMLLVDRQHMVHRAHHASMHGVWAQASPSLCEAHCSRFEAAWRESQDCLPVTTLGL